MGVLSPAQVLAGSAHHDHQPLSAAVMIENTHNWHGGVGLVLQGILQHLSGTARSNGLAVHLDGARIFNAAIATGADVRAIAQQQLHLSPLLPVQGLLLPGRQHIARTSRQIYTSQKRRGRCWAGYAASRSASRSGLVALETMAAGGADQIADENGVHWPRAWPRSGNRLRPQQGPDEHRVLQAEDMGRSPVRGRVREAGIARRSTARTWVRFVPPMTASAPRISSKHWPSAAKPSAANRIAREAGPYSAPSEEEADSSSTPREDGPPAAHRTPHTRHRSARRCALHQAPRQPGCSPFD